MNDHPTWAGFKWLLIVVFLMGCTAIYVSGDNNNIRPAKTIDLKTKAKVEEKK